MKRKSLVALVVGCLISSLSPAQAVLKTMLKLPDTGQTNSYTTANGEDADYTINPPSYILQNNNTTVYDSVTTLVWQRGDGGEMTFANAQTYCDTLTLGGFTDWRLPSCHELFSIFNHDKPNPAIDTNYFGHTLAEYWWSYELQYNDPNKVWVTNAGGGVGNHPKTETLSAGGNKRFHVRAVRDVNPPPTINPRFVNNNDGTTTDLLTGLMWQQIPTADSITWENALLFADTSTTAAYGDWRLPNIKEIQSITSASIGQPATPSTYFPGLLSLKYWSSTSMPNFTQKAWYLDNKFGITTYLDKINKAYAVCVRGGQTTSGLSNINSEELFFVYPNPGNGALTISSNNVIDQLIIMNDKGQIMESIFPNASTINYSIDKSGIYFIKILSKQKASIQKVIITK
jgi:hypothetical protein